MERSTDSTGSTGNLLIFTDEVTNFSPQIPPEFAHNQIMAYI